MALDAFTQGGCSLGSVQARCSAELSGGQVRGKDSGAQTLGSGAV